MSNPGPDLATMLAAFPADASWTLQQLDWAGARALMLQLPRATLRLAPFLDERVVTRETRGYWAPLSDVFARAADVAPGVPHAIFHIGHCGSTLLSRQLEQWPRVLALREPLVLRHLAQWHDYLREDAAAPVDAATWHAWLRRVLAVLARPHDGDDVAIVKATSNCNALVTPWLALSATTRAVALWIPLDEYLATILKAPDSRHDCRRFARLRWQVLAGVAGDGVPPLASLSTAEIVAMGWLAEVARFERLASSMSAQLRLVEFGALLAGGSAPLGEVAAHFGLDGDDGDALARALSPAVHGRYAKATEHAYDAQARAADLAESQRRFGDEIAAGMRFAAARIAAHPALAALSTRLTR